jgi:uncharacterized protein (TIGR02444 family)
LRQTALSLEQRFPSARKNSCLKTMNDAPSAFWDFSLRFYAKPGVPAACLELQDRGGADVNVVLFLLYLARRGRRISQADAAALDGAVAEWREQVVRPLRTARRHLKTVGLPFAGEPAAQLRNDIKRHELAAERIQQLALEQQFPCATFGEAADSAIAAASANLEAYATHIGALPATAVSSLLQSFDQP